MRDHVWNLRSGRSFRRLSRCFEKSRGRFGARLIEFSVQGNHLHLILEADGSQSLSRGMQGLCIRIAKALNVMMERSGKVLADHYHSPAPALAHRACQRHRLPARQRGAPPWPAQR